MSEKRQFRAIKGVRDILPPESERWNRVEQIAREVFSTYGFGEIRLPILEPTELFARSVGVDTDIVSKEMFTFVEPVAASREGRDRETNASSATVSLRPEATASVCRAFIEHGMHTWPGDVKLYYIGPMFRRERPQKGRYRQFYQIGAEVLGFSDTPGIDAELIEMLLVFFRRAGLGVPLADLSGLTLAESRQTGASRGVATLVINSIGCPQCRPKYVQVLRAALGKIREKLGPDSQRRIQTNPLRVLDSKLESEQAAIEGLPRISEHLCAACREHYAELKRQLGLRGISYSENWRLVRGLDYYTRTTFEVTAPGLGSQDAVCGGGRYDGLVELLGGPKGVKGIGFAIGTDRLMLSLAQAPDVQTPVERASVFIAWMGQPAYPVAVRLARRLRETGLRTELPHSEQKLKKALGQAAKLGARFAVIVGEEEVASGQFTVKDLAVGKQKKLTETELVPALSEHRQASDAQAGA
jgi:histidyl-tRNA synthetase